MAVKKVPEVLLVSCDNCGKEERLSYTVSLPNYWALIETTYHEEWAGGKSSKHYCPDCYKKMKITFIEESKNDR